MSTLLAAKRELAATKRVLEAMRAAQTLDDIEAAWRSFLQNANKVWTKLELVCKAPSPAQAWLGGHLRTRKTDMLLRYLKHARNSDEHTLTEIVSKQPGSIGIRGAPGTSGVYIKSMTINSGPQGTHIDYEGSPIEIVQTVPHVKLERVFDRGSWYNPPTQHLGQRLSQADPVSIAVAGFEYLRVMIEEAEGRFFPPAA
jgi:hypothetical protein